MGIPISRKRERLIQQLLGLGLNYSQVARRVGCDRKTVRSIHTGRRTRNASLARQIMEADREQLTLIPKPVKPYLCLGCTRAAGRSVIVSFRPCVVCAARLAKGSTVD